MTTAIAVAAGVILASHTRHASAQSTEPKQEESLTPAQFVQTAINVARAYGEPSPTSIEDATNTFAAAARVFQPNQTLPTLIDPSTGKPLVESPVDVVAMRGTFTYPGPAPTTEPAPTGTVLVVVVDADSGSVVSESLGDSQLDMHAINPTVTQWVG